MHIRYHKLLGLQLSKCVAPGYDGINALSNERVETHSNLQGGLLFELPCTVSTSVPPRLSSLCYP